MLADICLSALADICFSAASFFFFKAVLQPMLAAVRLKVQCFVDDILLVA